MTKRTRNKTISYAEVDSDQDWPSSADEDEVGGRAGTSEGGKGKGKGRAKDSGGDSYGAAKPPKKKARRLGTARKGKKKQSAAAAAPSEPEKPEYNADLLLDLPFDMLSEICSHLEVPDLISLSKVSHDFRKLFLSPSSRSIWAAKRRRDGYELLENMDELTFAHLLYGSACQECNQTPAETMFVFRVRLCDKCIAEQFVNARQAHSHIKNLHDETLNCVQTEDGFYRFADIEEVDIQLHELEDEDDETRNKNQRLSVGTTRSRRRASGTVGEIKEADAVKKFVDEKVALLKTEHDAVQRIWERQEQLRDEKLEAILIAQEKQREEEQEKMKQRLEELETQGWTTQQLDVYKTPWRRLLFELSVPEAEPADDPDSWRAYQNGIQDLLDEQEAERQAAPGRNQRLGVLRNLFNTLKDELEDDLVGVLPSFDEFKDLPAIRPLWHPADSELENENAAKKLPVGRTVLREFAERMRVEAIRLILAAQENKPLSKFSTDPARYPADQYDDAFFSRITSRFLGFVGRSRGSFTTVALPFPACVAILNTAYRALRAELAGAISYKQVCAIRTVVKAAGLDEDTVTTDDLDDLGAAFKWPTNPRVYQRSSSFNWIQMVQLLERRGPGIQKLKAGATVEFKFTAPDPKGKGKAAAQFAARIDSDDEDDLIGLSSEEEDVKPGRKALRVFDSEDEEEEDEEDSDA